MPMNLSLYPKNWKSIARDIKDGVKWQCEGCNRPCRKPGEDVDELADRLSGTLWAADLYHDVDSDEFGVVSVPKFGRFILTVAHLDHVPANCDRSNLRALCTVCHCRMDLKAIPTKRRLAQERRGQLNLFATPSA